MNFKGVTEAIEQAILLYRPMLSRVLEKHGDCTLCEYRETLFSYFKPPSEKFLDIVERRVETVLGRELAIKARITLGNAPVVNTGDHLGILSHPLVLQGNMLLDDLEARKPLVVFAFGTVPLNNHTYPRGILYKGKKIPLFPDSSKRMAVYGAGAVDKQRIAQLPSELSSLFRHVGHSGRFSSQIAHINRNIFEDGGLSEVVYLQAEDIAVELICDGLRNGGAVSKLLLDRHTRSAALNEFEGIMGAWTKESGTHFFWELGATGSLSALRVVDETLQGSVNRFPLHAEELLEALMERKIVPGMFLTFSTLLAEGVKCLGGFNQTDYLGKMKTGLVRLSVVSEDCKAPVPTDGFFLGALYLIGADGEPGGLEMIYEDRNSFKDRLVRKKASCTLRAATLLGLQSVASVFLPPGPERDAIVSYGTVRLARDLGILSE